MTRKFLGYSREGGGTTSWDYYEVTEDEKEEDVKTYLLMGFSRVESVDYPPLSWLNWAIGDLTNQLDKLEKNCNKPSTSYFILLEGMELRLEYLKELLRDIPPKIAAEHYRGSYTDVQWEEYMTKLEEEE